MILSLNWLNQFVALPKSARPQDIARRLIAHTCEVERWWRQDEYLENVVVGRVLRVEKHPNADKLSVCHVFDGADELQVVCGGSNVRAGMLCAFARVGARVRWHGKEAAEIKKTVLRGKQSSGMICAAEELGLSLGAEAPHEIMDLGDVDARPGEPLSRVLRADDVFFELDNKSINNRPDLWGHLGVAHELSALFSVPLRAQNAAPLKGGKPWSLKVAIVSAPACPRYQGVVIENVRVQASPAWMQRRLRACGYRPVNSVVDITNWVMLELGQPMHAFDLEHLETKPDAAAVAVRFAKLGEKLSALDGNTYALTQETLVIADQKNAIAAAGVIGGYTTRVRESTQTVLFEAANFNAARVRKGAQAIGVRTESSARFEKSLDPTLTAPALRRAVALLREQCPDVQVASPIADAGVWKERTVRIRFSPERAQERLGTDIPKAKQRALLESLGCSVRAQGKAFAVTVPSWRATGDLALEEDLIEEVGRLWGYDRITAALPVLPISPPRRDPLITLQSAVRNALILQMGFTEVMRYAFVSERRLRQCGFDPAQHLELANPLSEEERYLRRSLVPNLLALVEREMHEQERLGVFEIGTVFEDDGMGVPADVQNTTRLPRQDRWLCAAVCDRFKDNPFGIAARAAEVLRYRVGLAIELRRGTTAVWAHPGRCAQLMIDAQEAGWCAQVHPHVARSLGINDAVGVLCLNLSFAAAQPKTPFLYTPPAAYPSVKQDMALVVDRLASSKEISKAMRASCAALSGAELFDVYEGEGVPAGKKSLAYHLTFSHPDRTLATAEVEAYMAGILKELRKRFAVGVR